MSSRPRPESRSTTIANPVLRGMYPDPSWIWDEDHGRAMLVNSSFELVPGLPIHVSEDLAHWEPLACAVDADMARRLLIPFVADSGGLYAPTLRRIRGRYVIACTVARIDAEAAARAGVDEETLRAAQESEGNFVITADEPEGPWRGPFWIRGAEGIDPDVFEDVDGAVYWTQTRPAVHPQWEGQTEVWTQRIDPETWTLTPDEDREGEFTRVVLWNGYGLEAVWAEGPHLYRIGEWVYLMTAEGGTSFDHSEMAMRVHAPRGLWKAMRAFCARMADEGHAIRGARLAERSVAGRFGRLFHPDKKNPFLTHRHLGVQERVQCVGHADLMRHPRLGWWLTCLASRETAMEDGAHLSFLGRETFVAPVAWQHDPGRWSLESDGVRSQDDTPGWPVLAGGMGRLADELEVDAADGAVRRWRAADGDDGAFAVLDMRETPAPGASTQAATVRGDGTVVFRRLPGDRCVILCPEEGLTRIRQDDAHYVDVVTADGGGRVSWTARHGADEDRGDARCAHAHDACVVAVFDRGRLCIGVGSPSGGMDDVEGLACIDARFLSTEWSGGFVGCLVGAGR